MQQKTVFRAAMRGFVFMALLLSGCFTSEKPLLTADDAIAAFPDSFLMVKVDNDGNIKLDEKGNAVAEEVNRTGNVYTETVGTTPITLTLAELDRGAGMYLLQEVMTTGDPTAGKRHDTIDYVIVKYVDGILLKYSPPSIGKSGLDAALKKAGITYEDKAGDFSFTSKEQLMAAAHLYATRLVDGGVERYRIASTDKEKKALRDQLAQALARGKQATASSMPMAAATLNVAPTIDDVGASTPGPCDQQAAHPKDPKRMAPGVAMEAIVPALALRECQDAVTQFPHTGRFRYQLGRAQEASHDLASAVASYKQAAEMGYGMGWFNLGLSYGNGTGVQADSRIAATYLRNAMQAGIDAQAELQQFIFFPDGYSNPQFFAALFSGKLADINLKDAGVYLGEFMQLFHNTPKCQDVISTYALSKLLQGETLGTLGQLFGALTGSSHNYKPGDFGAAAQSGWSAGMNATNQLMLQVSHAQADAQLFYDRHGCNSPVSRQFFKNVEAVAASM